MDTGLRGKSVVVTGGGAGIGLATARLFCEEGAIVFAGDVDVSALGDSPGEGTIHGVEVDLGGAEGAQALIDEAVGNAGTVDCLVNNLGVFATRAGFLDISDEDWERTNRINFQAMVRCSRAALPHMVKQGSGSIVCLGSEGARQPDVFGADYCVSKAAVLMLAKLLSMEFGKDGVRVNAVSPGPTRTALWESPGGFTEYLAREYGMGRDEAVDHFAKNVRKLPLQRVGTPEEVARVIVFLSSDLASQVTGSDYSVDSGVKRAV